MIDFASPSTNSTNNSGKCLYPYIVYNQQYLVMDCLDLLMDLRFCSPQ